MGGKRQKDEERRLEYLGIHSPGGTVPSNNAWRDDLRAIFLKADRDNWLRNLTPEEQLHFVQEHRQAPRGGGKVPKNTRGPEEGCECRRRRWAVRE